MNAQTIKILVIVVVFILGLIFTSKSKSREGFASSSCPNLLIKKDGAYYLQNTRLLGST